MKTIKKIICPVDVYDFQPEAAEYAMTLATALDANVAVLYVLEPLPTHYSYEYSRVPNEFREGARQNPDAAMAEFLSEPYTLEPLAPRHDGYEYALNRSEFAETKQAAEAKLAEIIAKYFISCVEKGEVRLGHAADQIARAAKEYPADIIVMASHGRSFFGRAIHGSVTNKVLADSKIPVLVIHPSKDHSSAITRGCP